MSIPFTWIYLIHDPYTDLYKIGKSDDPDTRLKQLRSPSSYGTIPAAPTDYELIEAWLAPVETETRLHELFSEYRIRGEWFEFTDEAYAVESTMRTYQRWTCERSLEVDDLDQERWNLEQQLTESYNCLAYWGVRIELWRRMFCDSNRKTVIVKALPPVH